MIIPFLLGAAAFFIPRSAGASGFFSQLANRISSPRTSTAVYGPPELYGPMMPSTASQKLPNDVDVLARTLWGEDRNGGYKGMQSVANIIYNRYRKNTSSFGYGITGVCKKKGQFSCWNPETGYSVNANIRQNYNAMKSVSLSDKNFQTAVDIARLAIAGRLPDVTGGATYYLTKQAYAEDQRAGIKKAASWSYGESPVASIGNHYFFTYKQVNGRDI